MAKCRKKVWEKFAAFVVKCREARKHQGSRWLRTRLQPVCGCSLQFPISSFICSAFSRDCRCLMHARVRSIGQQMPRKKFGKSLQSLQSNAESLGNIRALDGYESDYRQAITIAYSHQLTIQLALDETAGQSPPGKERGFQSLVTESPKDIALEILNSLSYCHHPHHRIRHHLPDQALLDHHPVHCHHISVRQSMFLIHLLDHLKTCLQKIAHPHQ